MHHPVNKDDYLLVRAANPRTGVITPGAHSANSSKDCLDLKGTNTTCLPSRWRQKGDQWISLDFGEPSPSSTPPVVEGPSNPITTHVSQNPRLSQSLTQADANMRVPDGASPFVQQGRFPKTSSDSLTRDESAGFQTWSLTDGEGIDSKTKPETCHRRKFSYEYKADTIVKRKPVSSPLSKEHPQDKSSVRTDAEGSSETVVRRLRFPTDIRASSAPDPPRWRNFTPADVGKDLPSLPKEEHVPAASTRAEEPSKGDFLGEPQRCQGSNDPGSRIFNVSGLHTIEKELPCLPMNNGQFLSTRETDQLPGGTAEVNVQSMRTSTLQQPKTLIGPRGGDPSYPYIRTTHKTDHQSIKTLDNKIQENSPMPIPMYDNPPKYTSPLSKSKGPTLLGPRSMPPHRPTKATYLKAPAQLQSNTTFTPTNMRMNYSPMQQFAQAGQGHPPALNSHRVMQPGGYGLQTYRPQPRSLDMNIRTGIGMNIDNIEPVPLARIRPRGGARPPMPSRSDGSFGVPSISPDYDPNKSNEASFPATWTYPMYGKDVYQGQYSSQTNLIPAPLRPRVPTNPHNQMLTQNNNPTTDARIEDLSLMRKCSRCHHGFVDLKAPNMAGSTPISAPQNGPVVIEDGNRKSPSVEGSMTKSIGDAHDKIPLSPKATGLPSGVAATRDDRDHTRCCAECCKIEDCHEGCLGHPSPNSTPSPTKSVWSEVDCPSSASEAEDWEDDSLKSEKYRANRFAFVKSAFKRSPKQGHCKSNGSSTSASPELRSSVSESSIVPSPSRVKPEPLSVDRGSDGNTEGLNEAMKRAGSDQGSVSVSRVSPRKQRSSSSPLIGIGAFDSMSQKSTNGPQLKICSPQGLAIDYSGIKKSRNVSGTTVSTIELQVPGLRSLGFGVMGELAIVPFEASKMWIRNHPQVLNMCWVALERAWQMGQTITLTAWKLWSLIFVYSKTGKFKLCGGKGESASGFLVDCVRSITYLLIFAAVGAFIMRVLNVFVGVLGFFGWILKGFFWVLKQVLGVGRGK